MTYLKKVVSTLIFALFSPLYLVYIFGLMVLSPVTFIISLLINAHNDDGAARSVRQRHEDSIKDVHSVRKALGMSYIKHGASNLIFALFSPLYLLYIFALISLSPILFVAVKIFALGRHESHYDENNEKHNITKDAAALT